MQSTVWSEYGFWIVLNQFWVVQKAISLLISLRFNDSISCASYLNFPIRAIFSILRTKFTTNCFIFAQIRCKRASAICCVGLCVFYDRTADIVVISQHQPFGFTIAILTDKLIKYSAQETGWKKKYCIIWNVIAVLCHATPCQAKTCTL